MSIRHLVTLLLFCATPVLAQLPYASLEPHGSDTIYWYTAEAWDTSALIRFMVTAGPEGAEIEFPGARLFRIESTDFYRAALDVGPGVTGIKLAVARYPHIRRVDLSVLAVEPRMVDGIDAWGALDATVGERYNPSSNWANIDIPAAHYQTIVQVDGVVRFDTQGTQFQRSQIPASLEISDSTRSVRTLVYWRPQGTHDRSGWKLLASTDGSGDPAIPPGTRNLRIKPSH